MVDPLTVLHELPAGLILLIVGLTVLAESGFLIGVVLPGATALLALGVLARADLVPMWAAIPVGALAAVGGSQTGYLRGRYRGLRLPGRLTGPRDRASRLLAANERWAPLLTQWVVGVRTVTPRLAGSAGIGYRVYATASVPMGLLWGAVLVTGGYLAGELYQVLVHWLGWGSLALAVAVVAVVVVVLRVRRNREPADADATDAASVAEVTDGATR